LSSTTEKKSSERGQVLVLFAGGLVALLIVAALAFDVGSMLVERRSEQNAADAAALAGARFVLTSDPNARAAAQRIAKINGYDDADPNQVVNIFIPAIHGTYAGMPGFIEVQIESTRPSVFGAIIGRANWPVGAYAVATNKQNLNFPFSMAALNPTACASIKVSGGGVVQAYANIQSNSNGADCAPGAPVGFSRSGGSTVDVIADDATCRSVGQIVDSGSGSMTCAKAQNSFALPDPLRNLPAPTKPGLAPAMTYVGAEPPPSLPPKNCPGRTGADMPNEASPSMCSLGSPSGTYKNLEWILYPGLYPGGLEVSAGTTAYLMPGIYWIGGGGLSVKGGGSILSVATVTDATPDVSAATWGGGVLIYNSKLPAAPGGLGGPINLDGTGATMKLKPLNVAVTDPNAIYNHIVIFQDRDVTSPLTLNGSASFTKVEGIIYVPKGQVKLNGNGGTLVVDQIIADTFDIGGATGTIQVLHGTGIDAVIVAAGLVE
jgi:Flp pilus assembly protein TadG